MLKSTKDLSNLHAYKTWRLGKSYATLTMLFVITVLGFLLRFNKLSVQELWYDEAYTAEIINNSYKDIFILSKSDVHPPLYYFILKTWTMFNNSELMLRLPSVLFGTALIILVYKLVFYLTYDRTKSFVVALLIATNPFLIMYSREARSYSMLTFLMVLTVFELFKALSSKKYLSLAILLPLLFLTHYISIFLIIAVGFTLFIKDRRALKWLTPVITIVTIWTPILIHNSNNVGLKWIPKFSWSRIPESLQAFTLGITSNSSQNPIPNNPFLISGVIVSTIIISIFAYHIVKSKNNITKKILLGTSLIPILFIALVGFFTKTNFYIDRYLIGYLTILFIFLINSIKPKFNFLSFTYSILSIYLVLNVKLTLPKYRELATKIGDNPIVMSNASEFINLKYYSKNIKLQEGDWSSWGIIKKTDIIEKIKAPKSFYLVNRGKIQGYSESFMLYDFYFYKWVI